MLNFQVSLRCRHATYIILWSTGVKKTISQSSKCVFSCRKSVWPWSPGNYSPRWGFFFIRTSSAHDDRTARQRISMPICIRPLLWSLIQIYLMAYVLMLFFDGATGWFVDDGDQFAFWRKMIYYRVILQALHVIL